VSDITLRTHFLELEDGIYTRRTHGECEPASVICKISHDLVIFSHNPQQIYDECDKT
jgi:hypothetical protein